MSKRIAIIGAGIAGLTSAYELQRAGFEVTVFEKESRPGGRMSTVWKGDLPFDIGADHLGGTFDEMRKYCQEFGLSWQKMEAPVLGIYRAGKIYPGYEMLSRWSRLKFDFFIWRLGDDTDFFNASTAAKYDTDNAYDFLKQVAGVEAADYLAEGITGAYQFHRAKEASKGALIGYMQSVKREKGRWYLHRIKGGMIVLPKAFSQKLDVRFNAPVKKVIPGQNIIVDDQEFDLVILACPANVSRNILQNQTEEQKDLLENTEYATTISLAYKIDVDKLPSETVVFTPYKESQTVSGYSNQKMKEGDWTNQQKSLICTWLHEDFAKSIFDLPDTQILERCRHELAKVSPWLDSVDSLEPYNLYRWKEAMPKFKQGHLTRVKNFMENGQGENNVFFAGDYLNSPWTEGAIRCGQRVAKSIIERFGSDEAMQ